MNRNTLILLSLVMLSGTAESLVIQVIWSVTWLLILWYLIMKEENR